LDLTAWIQEAPKEAKKETCATEVKPKDKKESATPKTHPAPPKEKKIPWFEKYRPDKIEDIVGNPSAVESALKWANGWNGKKAPKKKAVIIYGPCGTGKTCLANCLCDHFGWEILEMNASDKRSKEIIERIAGIGSQTKSFSGAGKGIIVEEMEGLSGIADRGASQALTKIIKESRVPIILTCNDIKSKKLSGIKPYCEKIPLKHISLGTIVKLLAKILFAEGIKFKDIKVLQKVADNSGGDLRSALNDLQAMAQGEKELSPESIFLSERDRPIDVYKAMARIFKAKDYKECRRVMWSLDTEPRNFGAWLDENIPVEYKGKTMARAYDNLSTADIFLGRITNRQYWGFLRYVNDLMTVGIRYSTEKPNFGFPDYKFPSLISKMGATRGTRAKDASIAGKISPVVHASKNRIIVDYIPLLKGVYAQNAQAGRVLCEKFELDEEEMEYLER